jgi:hypothetical protein
MSHYLQSRGMSHGYQRYQTQTCSHRPKKKKHAHHNHLGERNKFRAYAYKPEDSGMLQVN